MSRISKGFSTVYYVSGKAPPSDIWDPHLLLDRAHRSVQKFDLVTWATMKFCLTLESSCFKLVNYSTSSDGTVTECRITKCMLTPTRISETYGIPLESGFYICGTLKPTELNLYTIGHVST